MSFVDRIIHVLDEYADSEYFENPIQAIREHIKSLINTKEEAQGCYLVTIWIQISKI